ncbi:MAG TPA: CRISPR-associated endonuclease Cas2 [Spirochaetota bacterium]|nr:CRISPR-associated endonuclease Cas2 [Spirochaetota bacterium]HPY88154.1 CRISPR-associated endonuclease Cas2 [Spirochaetota bacterium]HQB61406.1 CRISPR-associated endonuclease Cas2 [Spirochaetota bacterium]
MLVWFIYDITNDRTRRKIIKLAENSGLYRVQKSVFLGTIEQNILDQIVLESEELLDLENDSLYVFPLCEKDFKTVKLLGQAFDKKLVTDEIEAFFV